MQDRYTLRGPRTSVRTTGRGSPAGMSSSGKKVKWGGKEALIAKGQDGGQVHGAARRSSSFMFDRYVQPSPRAGELKVNMKAL